MATFFDPILGKLRTKDITALTKAAVEAVLTGEISSHSHASGGSDTYATKTSTGDWTVPAGVTLLKDVWLIAGGGGGGNGENGPAGGGGGAGGIMHLTNVNVTPAGTLAVVIGSGGAGATISKTSGAKGGNSTIIIDGVTHTAYGGGAGVGYNADPGDGHMNGGCGGGGTGNMGEPFGTGVPAVLGQIVITEGQGYNGGVGAGGVGAGSGGGGYSSAGAAATPGTKGGNGGAGITINSVGYAGGGGGGGAYDAAQPGGTATHRGGSGGGGGSILSAGSNAAANSGSGGGGGGADASPTPMNGGDGGSGIAIFRY